MFGDVKEAAGYYPRSGSSSSSFSFSSSWLDDGGGSVSHAGSETYGHGGGERVSCRRKGFTIEGENNGHPPIRVKETAAVSTYSYALLAKWKASTDGSGGGGGEGQEAERALRVLLTQMISRLDIQRGIL